jgi:lambda family phage portal protein
MKSRAELTNELNLNPTRMERAIAAVSPRRALSRMTSRIQMETMALVGGYYRGGRKGRNLSGWNVSSGDANTHLRDSVNTLRADSFDLYLNNPIAVSAVNTETDNVVGTGIQPIPSFDRDFLGITSDKEAKELTSAILREWELFTRTCDSTLMNTFEEQQEVALRSVMLSGDIFVNLPYLTRTDKGIDYELSVNLIEAHRVTNKDKAQDSGTQMMGVTLGKDGEPIKYSVLTSHPDSETDRQQAAWDVLDVWGTDGNRLVLHLYKQVRPNGVRGAPWLAPIIELVKKLDTLTNAEVDAAVLNSFFTVFLKKSMPNDSGSLPIDVLTNVGESDDSGELTLGSANILQLYGNEEIEFADPSRKHAEFEVFFKLLTTQIGSALGIPYEVLMKQFDSSYSASRGALIEAWKHFNVSRTWLVRSFCQPIYEEFLFEAAAKGKLPLKNYVNDQRFRLAWAKCDWIGTEQGQLNPLQEAKADEVNLRNDLTSRQRIAGKRGARWEDIHAQNLEAQTRIKEDGLADSLVLNPASATDDSTEPTRNDNDDDPQN